MTWSNQPKHAKNTRHLGNHTQQFFVSFALAEKDKIKIQLNKDKAHNKMISTKITWNKKKTN